MTDLEYRARYHDHDKSQAFVVMSMRYAADGIGYVVTDTGETISEATFKSRVANGRYEKIPDKR